MTIQRTVLLTLASVVMSTTAEAQCYRSRSPFVQPGYRFHFLPQTTYRLHTLVPGPQVAEIDPDPSAIEFGACSHVD